MADEIVVIPEHTRPRQLVELGRIHLRRLGQSTLKVAAFAFDAVGRPLTGIDVGAYVSREKQLESVQVLRTDSRGRVEFDLVPGDYTVIADLPEGKNGKALRVPGGETAIFVAQQEAPGPIVTLGEGIGLLGGLGLLYAGLTTDGMLGSLLTVMGASASGVSAYSAAKRRM